MPMASLREISARLSRMVPLLALIVLSAAAPEASANWDAWWTYDGISGPSYWGVINPAWTLCNKGRFQSPININPRKVAFDPTLDPVRVDKLPVSGVLYNTGQSLVFRADSDRRSMMPINMTGGPFSYRYQFEELYFHWGPSESGTGSEHSLDKAFFPAELQMLGFNSVLYRNMSEALNHAHGTVAISVMMRETDRDRTANRAIKAITTHVKKVRYRGQNYPIPRVNLAGLLPSTEAYLTYEGSTTFPGCWESVTWVVMNKPIYVTRTELEDMRLLMQGDKMQPKAPLANNVRPVQDLNGRSVRTNIKFERRKVKAGGNMCPEVVKDLTFKANSVWTSSVPKMENPYMRGGGGTYY